ncbi:NUDIX hydrolase [uncultured Cohaesibacter sp.]|uniref:NUDIX hydrolase n=1 Tax=uncultured Cohaesibacter sp. TaxID=1002546 RepID=UPI002930EC85|nr:NUDIX hydrolase [uncultured Cohaesibacter sp.]
MSLDTTPKHAQKISRLSSRLVYENRWIRLREDQVRFPGGHEGIYSVVDKVDFATIIPLHEDGRVQMVRQYRYPISGRFWELPQGSWEDAPDADPEALARGELAEETGFAAKRIEKLGEIFPAVGLLNQVCHIFLASELIAGEVAREETEQDMETEAFALDEIRAMIRKGEIKDSTTISAIGFWLMSAASSD